MASAWPEPPNARGSQVCVIVEALAFGIAETRTTVQDKIRCPGAVRVPDQGQGKPTAGRQRWALRTGTARLQAPDREARGTWQILATIWHVLLWPKVPLIALIAVAMSGGAS